MFMVLSTEINSVNHMAIYRRIYPTTFLLLKIATYLGIFHLCVSYYSRDQQRLFLYRTLPVALYSCGALC